MRQNEILFLIFGGIAIWWITRNANPGTFSSSAPFPGQGLLSDIIPMNVSSAGRAFIKMQEGFSATPYSDANGQSIGYGHFIQAGENYTSLTPLQASQLMDQDLVPVENAINNSVTVPINQNQFDALADFAYNVGVGAFKSSTLLKLLNQGNYSGASAQFSQWANSKRRAADANLFNSNTGSA